MDVSFRAEYFPISCSLHIEHQNVSMLVAVLPQGNASLKRLRDPLNYRYSTKSLEPF